MHSSFSYKFNQLHYQHGVTMIEAMISILLFAVGALGLVALQYSSMAGAADNQQRTVAIWKAEELVNRINANSGQIQTYINQVGNNSLDTIGVDSTTNVITCGNAPSTRCADFIANGSTSVTAGATCNDANKVTFDRCKW